MENVKTFIEWLELGKETEVRIEDNTLIVRICGCNVCPKRVGGYEIRGTACLIPGLLLGFIAGVQGLKIDPRTMTRNIQWEMGEICEFKIRLPTTPGRAT